MVKISPPGVTIISLDVTFHYTYLWRKCFIVGSEGTQFETVSVFKGVMHPYPKISMFCGLSQNYQHLFEK